MKTKFDFDPFELTGVELPKGADKNEILKECSGFLVSSVLEYVGEQNSPVAGHGRFKKLSKEYAKIKKSLGHPAIPNLELNSDMLNALDANPIRGGKIRLEVTGDEAAKADGHCNLSGKSELPTRRFIPDKDETFKKPIIDGLKEIILRAGEK